MKVIMKSLLAAVAILISMPGIVSADTVFMVSGDSISTAANWSAGLPNGTPPADPIGTIAIDGTYSLTNVNVFGGGTINHTAGNITVTGNGTGGDTNTGGNANFNLTQAGTIWNMSGGTHATRGLLANNTTINLSGGTMTLGTTASSSVGFGAANGGTLNISGSALVTSLQAFTIDNAKTTAGPASTFDFKSGWTGAITNPGFTTLTAWETAVLALSTTTNKTAISFDGAAIDSSALFNSTFQITNGGTTLSLAAVPEPTSVVLLGMASIGLIARRRRR